MLRSPVHEATVDCGTKATMTAKAGCGLLPPPTLPTGSNGAPFASLLLQTGKQENQKPKPKRRRKPQKPGKTAKQNERHFVVHSYHDHADDHSVSDSEQEEQRRRGGVSVSFPIKLHAVLDQVEMDGLADVISWQPHGRAFVIHKPKEFVGHIMPHYFRQTKLTSFQRQLNLYGFNRLTTGKDSGGYYHELFLRGKEFLCKKMLRTKVKGTKFKAASSPEEEPNFFAMVSCNMTDKTPPLCGLDISSWFLAAVWNIGSRCRNSTFY
jgi:hypothetical protein